MDRMSRSDHKKKKELEEARKAGTLPPEKDVDGNLINPHIPEFMSKAPWYLNQEGPGLKHQKAFRPEHTTVRGVGEEWVDAQCVVLFCLWVLCEGLACLFL
jgi:hypothetical protein